jgi:hypothetical protein
MTYVLNVIGNIVAYAAPPAMLEFGETMFASLSELLIARPEALDQAQRALDDWYRRETRHLEDLRTLILGGGSDAAEMLEAFDSIDELCRLGWKMSVSKNRKGQDVFRLVAPHVN